MLNTIEQRITEVERAYRLWRGAFQRFGFDSRAERVARALFLSRLQALDSARFRVAA